MTCMYLVLDVLREFTNFILWMWSKIIKIKLNILRDFTSISGITNHSIKCFINKSQNKSSSYKTYLKEHHRS